MTDKKETQELFGTKECTDIFTNYLMAQSSMLVGATSKELIDERLKRVKIVLGSISQTATSIAILAQHSFSNEAIMLARSFIEKAINFCYIVICSEEEYQNYIQYSRQKAYRKLDRNIEVNGKRVGLKFSGKNKISSELKDCLDKFTGEKGGEKTRWTKKSIIERLELVDKEKIINSGIFMLAYLSVYEDASEALHGTFYGCAFHTGFHLPEFKSGNKEDAIIREQKNLSTLAVNCGSIIENVIAIMNTRDNVGEYLDKAKNNSKNTIKLMDAVQINK
jgi:hypothetical protein